MGALVSEIYAPDSPGYDKQPPQGAIGRLSRDAVIGNSRQAMGELTVARGKRFDYILGLE